MNALARIVAEYLEAVRGFSRPARLFLLSTSLTFAAYGVNSVLFNLYLTAGGFRESFVGRVVSLNALGVVILALPAGLINPKLYELGNAQAKGGAAVFFDIVEGSNSTMTAKGFPARPGYDLVTGVGTVNAASFVYELAGVTG